MTSRRVKDQVTPGFRSGVLIPVIVVTLAAVLLAAFGLYWATTRSDQVSVDRQIRETRQAISSSIDELAVQQEVVAVWEDPVMQLQKPEFDWEWLDTNIGVWLHKLFSHHRIYVLDGQDAPVYATAEGERVEPETYAEVKASIQPLVDRVRGRSPDTSNRHERLPERPVHPETTVRTSENAFHATDMAEIAGRPAAVSVMRIDDPEAENRPPAGAEHLLVSIQFLDGAFLEELSKRNLIDSPRFSRVPEAEEGEHSIVLASESGDQIGYLFWRPELPGTAVLRTLGPVSALSAVLMVIIMTVLAYRLWRSMRKQQTILAELQASEAHAQHLAFHDVLTGLPNRAMFNDCLDRALARARRDDPVAVLLLDLDRFKHVNDTLGHLAGDALIREFADRLRAAVDEDMTIARLGGDEFAVLVAKAANTGDVEALCRRILLAVDRPFSLFGNDVFVGVSIGVATAAEGGYQRVDLLRRADIALYRAKGEGRHRYCIFTPAMDESVKLRSTIEEELRTALRTGEGLCVYYQPQVDGTGQEIVGLEALVRWRHPTRGLISPEHFISVAEETGLIGQLGEWVLREACQTSHRWPDFFIAVNLSPVQIRTSGFAERVLAIVQETGADPRRIELEITENVLLDDTGTASETLQKLRNAGLRIALDDFGTGYSSLSYLRRFDFDKIKIDRSFIQQLGHTADSAAIVTAVVTLGHAMGLTVTAEGVETAEQSRFLEGLGCNGLQGFFFSRAVPEEEIAALLAKTDRERGAA